MLASSVDNDPSGLDEDLIDSARLMRYLWTIVAVSALLHPHTHASVGSANAGQSVAVRGTEDDPGVTIRDPAPAAEIVASDLPSAGQAESLWFGHVIDQASGEPLAGARITVAEAAGGPADGVAGVT